jgi:hypothetical protein
VVTPEEASYNQPVVTNPEIAIEKLLYDGDDGGVSCSSAAADLTIADPTQTPHDITYCFVIENTGNTTLGQIAISDGPLNITEADMNIVSGGLPLAPGESVTYFYNVTLTEGLTNIATASGAPIDSSGDPDGPLINDTSNPSKFVYVFDPPFGIKTGTLNDQNIINWNMVWINDSPSTAEDVLIIDEVPEGTIYNGNLSCRAEGSTAIEKCMFIPADATYPRGHLEVIADIAPDQGATDQNSAANELVISFDVLIDATSDQNKISNQATLSFDSDDDGVLDSTSVTDNPVTGEALDATVIRLPAEDVAEFIAQEVAKILSNTGENQMLGFIVAPAIIIVSLVLQYKTAGSRNKHKNEAVK